MTTQEPKPVSPFTGATRPKAAPRVSSIWLKDCSDPVTTRRPPNSRITKDQLATRLTATEELLRGAFQILRYYDLGDSTEISSWLRNNPES